MINNEKAFEMLAWYTKVLNDRGVSFEMDELTIEAVELGIEEVDLNFLSEEEFKRLPDSLLFETYCFENEDGSYYFGYAILHPETKMDWIGVIRKDDEAIEITYFPFQPK